MRKCIRCQVDMLENCSIKVESSAQSIVLATDENWLFSNRIGIPKVAICPKCGEVSIYVENIEDLES